MQFPRLLLGLLSIFGKLACKQFYVEYYISDDECKMKIVQTSLTETEHKLLEEYAKKNSMTIKEVVKEAIRRAILERSVDKEDSLFTMPPSSKKTGVRDDGSKKHDMYLYGEHRGRGT